MKHQSCTLVLLIAAILVGAATPAQARIRCHNGFQSVGGQMIATPYCQDLLVFTVARQYGIKTSAAAIRNNPNHKRHVCRFIGRDIRVQPACESVNGSERRGR